VEDASLLRPLVLALFLVTGCETGSGFVRTVFYPTAQQNYDQGLKELKSENWLGALAYFQHIKTNFGFSKWATLSELGIADANLGRDKFTEAIDGYCAYKIGEAYHKQIPSDWFLAPPSYEKDLGPVHDALRELTHFSDQYGGSPYGPKARKLMGDCIQRLTDHELYVARFYLDRDKPYAAIGRLEGVLKDYPGARREPEVLMLLGKTYLKMEKPDRAREVFTKLATEHPDDYRAEKAKLYIQFIDRQKK